MALKIFKYTVLIILAGLALYQILKRGEYCTSFINAFLYVVFTALFVVAFLFISGADLLRYFNTKQQLDLIPLVVFGVFAITSIFTFITENVYFFKKKLYEGDIARSNLFNQATLTLFDNGSFEAKIPGNYNYCIYSGDYEMNDGILVLKREDITALSDKVLTSQYRLDAEKQLLVPEDSDFKAVKLKNFPK